MTDNNHPITPPPELVQQWMNDIYNDPHGDPHFVSSDDRALAARAAQWGYDQRGEVNEAQLQKARDQELEACCEWLKSEGHEYEHEALFAARRPKPPSLKEQALQALENADGADHPVVATVLTADQHALIRKALEQLDD